MTDDKQETSHWCWAASAQTVMKSLSGDLNIKQCDVVSAVFKDELTTNSNANLQLDCCKVGNEFVTPAGPDKDAIIKSRGVCIQNGWPEWVFDNRNVDKFQYKYSLVEYDTSTADPQGLSWEEITLQICDNPGRPFIFEVRWWGGGGHTLVVGGYRQTTDGSPFVEVYDPGRPDSPDFVVMPYEAYLGVPGDFLHERDYINIRK